MIVIINNTFAADPALSLTKVIFKQLAVAVNCAMDYCFFPQQS